MDPQEILRSTGHNQYWQLTRRSGMLKQSLGSAGIRRFNTVLAGSGDRPAGLLGVNEHWNPQGSMVLTQFRRVLAVDPQVKRV